MHFNKIYLFYQNLLNGTREKWRERGCFLKVRKTQGRGGWIVFSFSSFSPTEVTVQKQIDFSFWSDNHNLNGADKNREKERRKTQNNYTGSFHKPEVVLSPLHFQGEFTKNVISVGTKGVSQATYWVLTITRY